MPSFTAVIPDLQKNGPTVQITLSLHPDAEAALKEKNQPIPTPIQVQALIDTEATVTVIQQNLVQQLNLQPVGVTTIHTPSSRDIKSYLYTVRFQLPNNISGSGVVVAAPLEGQNVQCLIGRDILSMGVLVYIGYTNTFSFSM